ncbi:hypothetical protein T4D_17079 [Trichinella pseudospiralis]|uniref:Uncharacterized protein n=1 Tax=Trichinella pseudospiralis TaxID=6337 RepID=A0A0V1FBW9_TRIPS|nr:hypothetical protein T4D_17079 [Trichinella pseudospiralis]
MLIRDDFQTFIGYISQNILHTSFPNYFLFEQQFLRRELNKFFPQIDRFAVGHDIIKYLSLQMNCLKVTKLYVEILPSFCLHLLNMWLTDNCIGQIQ